MHTFTHTHTHTQEELNKNDMYKLPNTVSELIAVISNFSPED